MWIRMCYGVVDLKKSCPSLDIIANTWTQLLSKSCSHRTRYQNCWVVFFSPTSTVNPFCTEPPLDSFNLIIIEWFHLIPCPVVPFPEYDIALSWLSRYGTATINIYRWENFLRKSCIWIALSWSSQLPQDCHMSLCVNSYGTLYSDCNK